MEPVAARLRHLFEAVRKPDGTKWTLEEVARGTDLSVSYVWRLRAGRAANPTRSVLERIAQFFGVPASYLLGYEDVPPGLGRSRASPAVASDRVEKATALYRSGNLEEAERTLREAYDEAVAARDDIMAGRALTALAAVLVRTERVDEARETVNRALRLLRGPEAGHTWIQAVVTLSRIDYASERFADAYFRARQALVALGADVDDERLCLEVHHRLGSAARRVGRLQEAALHLEQAVAMAERLGEAFLAATLLALGLTYLDSGQAERALECFRKALSVSVAARLPRDAARAQHNTGLAYASLGRWQEAIESLAKSLGSNEALGDIRIILYDHMELGWCYANVGQREMALRHAYAALALAQEHDRKGDRARAHWHLGRVLTLVGEAKEAERHYAEAVALLEELGLEVELCRARVEMGEMLLAQGHPDRAASLFRSAALTAIQGQSQRLPLVESLSAEGHEVELLP